MIARLSVRQEENPSVGEPDFLELLPKIHQVAGYAFRHTRRAVREELVAEVVANAFVTFRRMVAQGKACLVYPTVLARFAIKQVREGRRVGSKRSVLDALSPYAQSRKKFSVELPSQRAVNGDWEELTTDRKATPAEIAACRIDFRSWLDQLQQFKRRVALALASGATTSEAAREFKLSRARVSQLRMELAESWNSFQAVPAAM